jgi:hypothetical protein
MHTILKMGLENPKIQGQPTPERTNDTAGIVPIT